MLGYADLDEEAPPKWVDLPHKEYEIPTEWLALKAELEALKTERVLSSHKMMEIEPKIIDCYEQTNTLRRMHEKLSGSNYYEKFGELLSEFELNCGLVQLVEEYSVEAGKVDAINGILQLERKGLACPVCFERDVNVFLDGCGHTFCKECIEKSTKGRTTTVCCPSCRNASGGIRPLFFT